MIEIESLLCYFDWAYHMSSITAKETKRSTIFLAIIWNAQPTKDTR